jgi:hypothetical protein
LKESIELEEIIELIDSLAKNIEEADLRVSLSGFKRFVLPIKTKLEAMKKDDSTKEIREELKKQIDTIESIVFSETSIKYIYVLPQRRFNGEYLTSMPSKLLNEGIFERLPDMAAFDFKATCRCLLYGEGTATAFHILRATEEVLKHFYFKYKRTNRLNKPMWGSMTRELSAKKKNKPDETILKSLDLVRNSYRNPTQHPEMKYDIESAQNLFGVCIDLINKMAIELETK